MSLSIPCVRGRRGSDFCVFSVFMCGASAELKGKRQWGRRRSRGGGRRHTSTEPHVARVTAPTTHTHTVTPVTGAPSVLLDAALIHAAKWRGLAVDERSMSKKIELINPSVSNESCVQVRKNAIARPSPPNLLFLLIRVVYVCV